MFMSLTTAVLTAVLICTVTFDGSHADDLQWDELIFTQEWGFSACRQFKDRSQTERKCRYEGRPSVWSVHGIWPTKEGTKGPSFCKKVKFDMAALTPIMNDLNQFWYEIDETKDAHKFWEHEWLKHGSCAMQSETFGNELLYFGEGLTLRSKLDLYSIFKSGGIIPSNDKGYKLTDFHSAFKKAIGQESAVPYVQCLRTKNHKTKAAEYHILQFEICLDTQLQVVSCNAKKRLIDVVAERDHAHADEQEQEQGQEQIGDQAEPCPGDVPIWYNDYGQDKLTKTSEEL